MSYDINRKLLLTLSVSIYLAIGLVKAQNESLYKNFKQEDYIQMFGSLNNTYTCIKKNKKIKIAYLGGSITQNPGWREKVCSFLQETYPETQFTFIHAGIGSLGSLPHAFRLENDVLSKGKIDLLFYESAVNDAVNGTDSLTQGRAIEGIIRHLLTVNPNIDIVMMAFADPGKLSDYKKGKVPAEVAMHRRMAEYYHLPLINLAKEVYDRTERGEFSWKNDFKDLHPSPFGQEVYFQAIKAMLQNSDSLYHNEGIKKKNFPKQLDQYAYSSGKYVPVTQADKLIGFHINPKWHPIKGSTRPGFVDLPVLEGDQPGASFEFSFIGNTVGICIASGYDAGIISYTIDNKQAKIVSLRTSWSNALHLPWYLLLGNGLSNSKHILKVTIPADTLSSISACRIVHFLVN